MSTINIHDEWLSLLDISGTFLAPPVLKEAYPQGLDALDGLKRKRLRQTYEEWNDSYLAGEKEFPRIHEAWIREVLLNCLDYGHGGGQFLKSGKDIPASLHCPITEYGVTLLPEYALVDSQREKPNLLLIQSYPRDVDLNKLMKYEQYSATPVDQMVQLCRVSQCRLGLVTNGENWVLIDAPVGSMSTSAGWQGRYWVSEAITLQSFIHLLGISRFFVSTEEQLPALIDRSLQYQDEVTSALGTQIQRAIEVLIQSLDKYDLESGRTLLGGVTESELYEAALTVMMRLVFLLSAEERGLLLLDDGTYQRNYALSTLRIQLRQESDEILERRWDAWSRLLALFRMVYGGVEHENFRLPALGGSLFDPDRFAFLEGRAKGSNWRVDQAKPLPIDNRTVLLLLEAIQQFEGRTLSYRSLDVEQIGYVYEGLLERTVKRTSEIILDVGATRSAEKPLVALNELEAMRQGGDGVLEAFLVERSGSSLSRIRNDLSKPVDERLFEKLLTACAGDPTLRDQIKHYANLLRNDSWGYPLVYPAGSFVVTTGSDRRETGSHYTPKPLTEAIVTETLTPIVYVGPAEGLPRENWKLKSPEEILDLKICDPAMGSGAFLVQVCRWLSDQLIDSWANAEAEGLVITSEGQTKESIDAPQLMPPDLEARIVIARRLIAERCLYGSDINHLAVQLAKLSIWLVTLSKDRPFGFLDHNLRQGDSLLGIQSLDQLVTLDMNPSEASGQRIFGGGIRASVKEAIELRKNLRMQPIRNIHDVELMAKLDEEAREKLIFPHMVADAFIGSVLRSRGNKDSIEVFSTDINITAGKVIEGSVIDGDRLYEIANLGLGTDLLPGKNLRKPFHWPLEFPEVFERPNVGFDAVVGNPPFLGNRLWKDSFGDLFQWQCQMVLNTPPGRIDLCVVFHRRVADLIRNNGCYGMLAQTNIAEGSSLAVGLNVLVAKGDIFYARKGMQWPGSATVIVAIVGFYKGQWGGQCIADNAACKRIGPRLEPQSNDQWLPMELDQEVFSFAGVDNSKGLAFVLTRESLWFNRLQEEPNSLLRPYITGDDINSSALNKIDRWALDIADRSLEEIGRNWPIAAQFLKDVVHATRTTTALQSYRGLIDRWWQFWNHRAQLMRRLRGHSKFIAYSKVTKYPICVLADSNWIYTNKVLLISFDRPDLHAICLSSLFRAWIEKFCGGGLGATLQLSITESVQKFPLPAEQVSNAGIDAAIEFDKAIRKYALEHNCGTTIAMNAVHDNSNHDSSIKILRELMQKIDIEVAKTYKLKNLNLTYEFQIIESLDNGQTLWSLPESETIKILDALLELNKKLYLLNKKEIPASKLRKKSENQPIESDAKEAIQKGFNF